MEIPLSFIVRKNRKLMLTDVLRLESFMIDRPCFFFSPPKKRPVRRCETCVNTMEKFRFITKVKVIALIIDAIANSHTFGKKIRR